MRHRPNSRAEARTPACSRTTAAKKSRHTITVIHKPVFSAPRPRRNLLLFFKDQKSNPLLLRIHTLIPALFQRLKLLPKLKKMIVIQRAGEGILCTGTQRRWLKDADERADAPTSSASCCSCRSRC